LQLLENLAAMALSETTVTVLVVLMGFPKKLVMLVRSVKNNFNMVVICG
jgi:hypothetical protein